MDCDVAVVGGGIVGAATALALTRQAPGCRVLVLEKEPRLAAHQTGNNSGVIHSGLYYRPGSLKAQNCVSGREALYRFCAEHDIPHDRCGKIVVASRASELPALEELERRGHANGLQGIERLDRAGLKACEPYVEGVAGLRVPETGIVDYVAVTQAFARLVTAAGSRIVTEAEVLAVERRDGRFELTTRAGKASARFLINCAGLHCDRVAWLCGVDPGLRIVPFRGEYYTLKPQRRSMVRNLIYPVPDPAFPFLGVHYTRMIDGEVEAGPNAVLAFKREGYRWRDVSLRDTLDTLTWPGFLRLASRFWRVGMQEYRRSWLKPYMVRDLQKLLPSLRSCDIHRAGAGVRAQAVAADGQLVDDFRLVETEGMVHVLNAPSPAATASLSIGETVVRKAVAHFAL
ncbi:MAG: L-2-hydroxyglutarate oxidase [Desulfuromonadaceae bacterium]|nr:L-2-hydroxyglutarate oxidase [Desulfuromonadaceae bacterium]